MNSNTVRLRPVQGTRTLSSGDFEKELRENKQAALVDM